MEYRGGPLAYMARSVTDYVSYLYSNLLQYSRCTYVYDHRAIE
jgi:hypothetical protein